MGLYDFLEDKCVKCFYEISFYKTEYEIDNNKSGITYISGNSKSFEVGDKLPLKTNYYLYPKDFYIYDYTSNDRIIHVIENEIYKGYVSIENIDLDFENAYIINSDGLEILDIKSKDDFYEIANHWSDCKKEYSNLSLKYFPQGTLSMFMHNTVKYNQVKPQFDKEIDAVLKDFRDIWVKEDEYYIEKRYGTLVEAIKNLYWDLKNNDELSDKEKSFSLSLAYEELEVFSHKHEDAKERYLKLFDSTPEFYVNNIISMAEKFINF